VSAADPLVIQFEHAYDFETSTSNGTFTYWDGGVIEISDDGGASWKDISLYADPGYTGTLTTSNVNALSQRAAYANQNPSYPAADTVSLDLGTELGGKTVRVRFRIGTDSSVGAEGWSIDNLAFSGITNTPFTAITPDEGLCQLLPAAAAGADQTVHGHDAVTLDAAASSDPNGDALSFTWSQSAGPAVEAWAMAGSKAIFVAPDVTEETTLSFDVQVSDGQGATSDTVVVTVLPREPGGQGGSGGGAGAGAGGTGGSGGSGGGAGTGGTGPTGYDPYSSDDGCGCAVVGDEGAGRAASSSRAASAIGALAAVGLVMARRRRRAQG
jgi:hypothetical protein